jgi:hypothetical protein
MAYLRLPAAVVAREFMHEDDRRAGAGFLVVELDAVVGSQGRHALYSWQMVISPLPVLLGPEKPKTNEKIAARGVDRRRLFASSLRVISAIA